METISQWLGERLRVEHLSLRQAGAKTGLSHAAIANLLNGGHPSPKTIRKLTRAFRGNGRQRLVLEDRLLTLTGYRTPRPEGEEPSEIMAELMDRVEKFSDPQFRMMINFAGFLVETGNQEKRREIEKARK